MSVVDRLLKPRSVAIVGASADTAKLTGRPLAYPCGMSTCLEGGAATGKPAVAETGAIPRLAVAGSSQTNLGCN